MAAAAFVLLGLLIGTLVGLSASSLATGLIGLLFAFGGGSAVAFAQVKSTKLQRTTSVAIITLSLGCLAGLYSAVYVSEHQVLSPSPARAARDTLPLEERKYIRDAILTPANAIDQLYSQDLISADSAYAQLRRVVISKAPREQ
jgi:hypothetical protein